MLDQKNLNKSDDVDSDVPAQNKKKKKSADSDEEFVSLADKSLTTPSRAARGKAKKAKYNFSSSEEDD